MAKRIWKVLLEGNSQTIEVRHGHLSGSRSIWLNGVMLERSRQIIDYGSLHVFRIGAHACELEILTNGLTFDYFLTIDQVPRISEEQRTSRKSPSRLLKARLAAHDFWLGLGRSLQLQHMPSSNVPRGELRYRFTGRLRGYLVSVSPSLIGVLTVVRYKPAGGSLDLMRQDSRLGDVLGKQKANPRQVGIDERSCWFALSSQPTKDTPGSIAERINRFIEILRQYVSPTNADTCEGPICKVKTGEPLKVVFINMTPQLLCPLCVAEAGNIGKENRQAYDTAPTRLVPGLLAGAAAAVIGGAGWAVLTLVTNQNAAVFAAAIMLIILKAMDWVGTKRTRLSMLVLALLSLAGVLWGVYLVELWWMLREIGDAFQWSALPDLLRIAWELMWVDSRFLAQALTFGAIGIGLYLISFWLNYRSALSAYLKPDIEITESGS